MGDGLVAEQRACFFLGRSLAVVQNQPDARLHAVVRLVQLGQLGVLFLARLVLGQAVVIFFFARLILGQAGLVLLFAGLKLGDAVLILLYAVVILLLRSLQLGIAVGQQPFAVGQLGHAVLILGLGVQQLLPAVLQLGGAVVDQRLVVGQFGRAVGVFLLAVEVFLFAVGQLLAAVGQFLRGVGQLLLRFGLGVVVFGPGVVDLGLRLAADLVIAGLGAGGFQRFDLVLDGRHDGVVGILHAVGFPRAVHRQVDLGVGLVGKILGAQVHDEVDRAVADAGGFALKTAVVGVVHNAHHRVLGTSQRGVEVLVVGADGQLGADGAAAAHQAGVGLDDTFAGLLRQAAFLQKQAVDGIFAVGRQAEQPRDEDVVAGIDEQVGRIAGLHAAHALDCLQRFNVTVTEAHAGNNAQIVKIGVVHILFHRLFHVEGGGVEPRQEPYAQRHDGKNGQETAARAFEGAYYIFAVSPGHVTIRSFRPGWGWGCRSARSRGRC